LPNSIDKLEQARRKRDAARRQRQPAAKTAASPTADDPPSAEAAPFFRQDPPVEPLAICQLHKPFRIEPETFDDVLRLCPADVAHCEAARLNLLCATNLPGAENLDVEALLHRLDLWSAWIGQQTEANLHRFHEAPEQFNHSEAFWRVLTIATVLQSNFGVHYDPRLKDGTGWDWKDSLDVLLHGPLGSRRTGTCPSLPVLMAAVGRRLGYPIRLVHAPAHVFSRWDGPALNRPDLDDRFNIEYHGNGMNTHDDDHYRQWPVKWTPEVHAAENRRTLPLYLRSLEPAEELASFFTHRSHVLFENGRHDECFAAAMAASRLAPHDPVHAMTTQSAHRAKLQAALRPWGLTDTTFFDLLRLRQAGSETKLPWEAHGHDPMRPGVPAGTPAAGIPAIPNSPIADPIAAAVAAFEVNHVNGHPRPGRAVLNQVPELTLQTAEWKVPL
jgi:hypothetical protein